MGPWPCLGVERMTRIHRGCWTPGLPKFSWELVLHNTHISAVYSCSLVPFFTLTQQTWYLGLRGTQSHFFLNRPRPPDFTHFSAVLLRKRYQFCFSGCSLFVIAHWEWDLLIHWVPEKPDIKAKVPLVFYFLLIQLEITFSSIKNLKLKNHSLTYTWTSIAGHLTYFL